MNILKVSSRLNINRHNRHSKEILSDKEVTYVRQLIRKVNWLATQTKHDLSFDVNNLMSYLEENKVDSIRKLLIMYRDEIKTDNKAAFIRKASMTFLPPTIS